MEILGEDGFPIPQPKRTDRFLCVCAICMGADANMKVAKNGNWIVRCPTCKTILYLNDLTSINLFRGLQAFLNADPEHQVRHTTGIVAHAPDAGS
jgi:hypothetical protein